MITLRDFKKDPVKFASELLQEAEKDFSDLQPRIDRNREHNQLDSESLRARRQSSPERAALYMPEIRPAKDARVANMQDLILGDAHPYVVSPRDKRPLYIDAAAKRQLLLEYQLSKGDFEEALWGWMDNAELYPYSWLYCSWEEQWEVVREKQSLPAMLGRYRIGDRDRYIEYDQMFYAGPKWYALQPEDVRFDTTARRRGDIQWFSFIVETSLQYLKAMEAQGNYGERAGGESVSKLNPVEGEGQEQYRTNHWYRDRRKQFKFMNRKGRELELVQFWIKLYDEDWDQMRMWRLSFVGDVPLLLQPAPWPGVGFPAVLVNSRPLPGEVVGMSTADLGHSLQEAKNIFMSQMIEGGAMAIRPIIAYGGNVYSDPSYNPANWIKMDAPGTLKQMQAVPPMWLKDNISMVSENAKQVMGATEVMQAVSRSDKEQTLGEYQGRRLTANKILGMNLRHYLPGLVKTAQDALLMSADELPPGIALGLFDEDPAIAALTAEELITAVNVDMPKIRALANQEEDYMRANLIYQMFVQGMNPFVYSNPLHLYEVSRKFLLALGESDVESILGKPPAEGMAPQINSGGINGQGQEGPGFNQAGGIPGQAQVPALPGPA